MALKDDRVEQCFECLFVVVQIVQGDLLEGSINFAKSVIGKPLESRRLRLQPVKGGDKAVPAFDGTSVGNFVPRQKNAALVFVNYDNMQFSAQTPFSRYKQTGNTLKQLNDDVNEI